jgi:hypothetical protein
MVAGLHNQLSFSFKDFLNPATIRICFSRIFAEEARLTPSSSELTRIAHVRAALTTRNGPGTGKRVPSDNSLRVSQLNDLNGFVNQEGALQEAIAADVKRRLEPPRSERGLSSPYLGLTSAAKRRASTETFWILSSTTI